MRKRPQVTRMIPMTNNGDGSLSPVCLVLQRSSEILDQRRLRGKRVKWMTAVRYICIEVKGSMCKSGFGIKSFQVPHEIKALGNGRWLNRGEIHTRVSLDLKISAFDVRPMLCPDVRYLAVCQSHHTSERVGVRDTYEVSFFGLMFPSLQVYSSSISPSSLPECSAGSSLASIRAGGVLVL